jgi:hypothetical protein
VHNYFLTYCLVGSTLTVVKRAMCHHISCGFKTNDMERPYVSPNDVCKITGKKIRYAQQLLKDLRALLKKEKHQLITKKELADYLGIDEHLIALDS